MISSVLITFGGFSQLYVIIVGAQTFPLVLFKGKEISSSFFDGYIEHYVPSYHEFGLSLVGLMIAFSIVFVSLQLLNLIPQQHKRVT